MVRSTAPAGSFGYLRQDRWHLHAVRFAFGRTGAGIIDRAVVVGDDWVSVEVDRPRPVPMVRAGSVSDDGMGDSLGRANDAVRAFANGYLADRGGWSCLYRRCWFLSFGTAAIS